MRNARVFKGINHGLLVAALYCAAFLILWRMSMDQWYLPAGLRAVALLFLPFRLWPYVFLGDAAAVLSLRWPKVENYSVEWALVPAATLLPLICIPVLIARKYLKDSATHARWLTVVLLATALWGQMWMHALNHVLTNQSNSAVLSSFLKWSTGDYLGMMMVVLPAAIWHQRMEYSQRARLLARDTAVAVGLIVSILLAVMVSALEPSLKQFLCMLMFGPAVALTLMHGWRGAALGIVMVNIAIALTLPALNAVGAYDGTTFVAQQALAVTASVLLSVGAIITAHFDHARRLGVAEAHAMDIARASILQTERHLRDRVIVLAQMQARIEDSKADLIRRLKEHGRYAAAMDVMRDAALHDELFEAHASALYPLSIDTLGLYNALQSPSFSAVWANQRPVRLCLRGQPLLLTVPLQVAAYRCACNAIALLSPGDPSRYRVHARTWQAGDVRGIAVVVQAHGGAGEANTRASTLAELELEGRLKMHGGALRRRRDDRLVFLLAEPMAASARGYSGEPGTMDQLSPLVP